MFRYGKLVGYTLIEILTVVAIIGILATLSVGPIKAAQQRSRDAQRKSDMNLLAQALDLYYSENHTLPGDGSTCSYKSGKTTAWIPGLTSRYLPSSNGKVIPVDPLKDKAEFYYTYTDLICDKSEILGQTFKVQAFLENKKDKDGIEENDKLVYEVVR